MWCGNKLRLIGCSQSLWEALSCTGSFMHSIQYMVMVKEYGFKKNLFCCFGQQYIASNLYVAEWHVVFFCKKNPTLLHLLKKNDCFGGSTQWPKRQKTRNKENRTDSCFFFFFALVGITKCLWHALVCKKTHPNPRSETAEKKTFCPLFKNLYTIWLMGIFFSVFIWNC